MSCMSAIRGSADRSLLLLCKLQASQGWELLSRECRSTQLEPTPSVVGGVGCLLCLCVAACKHVWQGSMLGCS